MTLGLDVAFDPGKRLAGLAIGNELGLVWASPIAEPSGNPAKLAEAVLAAVLQHGGAVKGSRWVLERPRYYADRTETHTNLESLDAANDAVAKLVRRAGGRVVFVYPSGWKGNAPKEVCRARIRKHLSAAEVARIVEPDDHNVWDAVGIWMWGTKRLRRGLVL